MNNKHMWVLGLVTLLAIPSSARADEDFLETSDMSSLSESVGPEATPTPADFLGYVNFEAFPGEEMPMDQTPLETLPEEPTEVVKREPDMLVDTPEPEFHAGSMDGGLNLADLRATLENATEYNDQQFIYKPTHLSTEDQFRAVNQAWGNPVMQWPTGTQPPSYLPTDPEAENYAEETTRGTIVMTYHYILLFIDMIPEMVQEMVMTQVNHAFAEYQRGNIDEAMEIMGRASDLTIDAGGRVN